MTWAEDRAPVGTDPSADPGAVSEGRAAGCRPPSPFAYSTNAINPIRNYYLPPANPRLPGFHFTLNQDNTIEARTMETWWDHLLANGSASTDPDSANCPHIWRARVVGAILATCLPSRIEVDPNDKSTIRLL